MRSWAALLNMRAHGHLRRLRACRLILVMVVILLLAACNQTDVVSNRGGGEQAFESGSSPTSLDGATQGADGAAIYNASCASCHGPDGEGEPNWKTPEEDGTFPAPPHTVDGHTWHHGDGTLFKIIKGGGDSLNIPNFKSNMPAFAETLSDEEIVAVLDYLKSWWPEEQRQLQSEISERDPLPDS